ncbi:MAG: TRAP transporter substrate-binding protein [Rhodobacteraceae bacterium]|nr:TRAP transporter substrate-binding protein [Paracoccaceae bacterium]
MKRISLLIGGAAVAVAMASSAMAQEVTLRLHQFLPLQAAIPANAIQPWIDKIEADSGGRIKIEHYPSMQLGGSPPSLYGQAKDGVVDIIWTLMGYTPGRFPTSEAFELPFMTGSSEASSRAFHEYMVANAMDEFADTRPLVFHTHGPGWIHSNKPITKLEDVSGQKLRGPTRVITNLLGKLGATPVGMPVPAVPEALSKGVIDGTVLPFEVTVPLRISELVENHTGFETNPGLYTATFVLTMNNDSYDRLPDDLKAVIDANSGPDVAAMFGAVMDAADIKGREIAEASGNTVTALDDTEKARWMAAAQPVVDDWLVEMDALGIDGQALIDSAKTLIAKYEK